MSNHYICTGGCEGVSDKPGVCEAKDCPRHGKPLVDCNCMDGTHEMPAKASEEEEK